MADNTFTPPEGVRSAAKRALKWIADGKAGSGFTSVGHGRATQLANGEAISLETLNRMKSFFSRHEVDKKATGFNEGEQGFPSHGRVAWDAWGGNAGFAWAKSKVGEAENSMKKNIDIAPRLVELSVDKLRSLHERLHKSVESAALLELHHLTTTEMARRGMELPANDEWENVRIEIDYFEDVDLESFSSTLPAAQIEQVIKATGTNIADVRMVLTSVGYAMEIAPDDSVEKMIKHEKDKWVVYDHSGMHPLGTYDTKEEAANRIAEIEYFRKYNQNHDPANGEFASGSGGAGGADSITGKPGSNSYSNQIADSLVAGGSPSIDAKDVGKFLNTMANRGDNPDITNLKVNGHTLFGGEGMGIKRSEMPQIPMGMRKQFIQDMHDQGISTDLQKIDAMKLKPSQSEISATKTARLYEHFKKDGIPQDKAILVSKDGFVVDGHHHWAAAAAMGLMGKDGKIPVIVMDVGIKQALSAAKAWSDSHGIAAQDINSAELPVGKTLDESDYFVKFNPNHDDHGRFSTSTGGGSSGATATGNTQDGSQVVNGIKVPPLAKEPEIKAHNPVALAKAKEINETAKRVEPAITNLITAIAQRSGGEFVQLDQRIKSTEALAGKIEREAVSEHGGDLDKAAAGISDAVRYTLKVPQSEYTNSFDSTIKVLQDAGFTAIRPKNFWQSGDPYDGANIKAIKNGIQIEIQLHTPQSFAMKERIHGYYKAYRESPNDTTRKRMWTRMVNIAKTLEKPANYSTLLGIGTLVLQQFQTAQEVGLVKSTRVDILNLNKREW
jgi:hypothetical protein